MQHQSGLERSFQNSKTEKKSQQ